MAKHTLKILRCSHRKILKVCMAISQHYERVNVLQVIINTKRHSLVQFVFKSAFFQEKKVCNFKIDLISILNTKQTNGDIFSNKARENFNLAKIF